MLVLLPPSEAKAAPRRGAPLDLGGLSFPQLTTQRQRVLDALTALCRGERAHAVSVLGLSPGLAGEVDRDAGLDRAATAPAARVYTGVLYEALSLATLDPAARRRAHRQTAIVSGLWGALRLVDRIPAYRLAMDVDLPGAGPLAGVWRPVLGQVLPWAAARGVVVDLRSAAYAAAWRPSGEVAARTVSVRVVREQAGVRTVVSHLAKHHRGEVARHLALEASPPRTPEELVESLATRWTVSLDPARPGRSRSLELVVAG